MTLSSDALGTRWAIRQAVQTYGRRPPMSGSGWLTSGNDSLMNETPSLMIGTCWPSVTSTSSLRGMSPARHHR